MSDNKFTGSNNKYTDCPALMSDGRGFTDYRPINHINNLLISNNDIENNYAYREFLTQNAQSLIDINRGIAIKNNICDQCPGIYKEESNSNDTTTSECVQGTEGKKHAEV
tara:strand:+ start:2623 stop:2952 length:330 start_codon:yes stop_codon:yes gene_type:complete